MPIILKATSKGQITLPAKWRKPLKTNQFIVEHTQDRLIVRPLFIDKKSPRKEYTVFDAIRDNKGKGIRAKDLVRALKKMR